ncbi:ATP-binding protein [Paenibacillus methanolicus]|uniref:histidine kinase n=1 Tax=Paenibacillus methanolicus TaxID=582686 RepID=A0A5S5BPL3_9BACL|nr:ATP-binding protein [Paenibacillus methanolicus]TYP68072.1 two-component system, sporulation sensor kinase D [Paenibacillus methanolicus]
MTIAAKQLSPRHTGLLYFLIVLVPMGLFSLTFLQVKTNSAYDELGDTARQLSGVHALYVESFFSETIGRMESLSIYLSGEPENSELMERMLAATHQVDQRFSGFYIADANGDIVSSSNPSEIKGNVSGRAEFRLALLTRKRQVSEPHFGQGTGQYYVSIATPIPSHSGNIRHVIIGSLQIGEMQKGLQHLVRDENVRMYDRSGHVLLQTEDLAADGHTVSSSILLEAVPWQVEATLALDYANAVWKPYLIYAAAVLVILNCVFFLVKAVLAKRRVDRELARIEADKLKLIGTIAAGTAHEIRNPLTGIKGFISLLSQKYTDERDQYYFALIQTEVNRINDIVSELLLIGKPAGLRKETIVVQDVMKEVLPLFESEAQLQHARVTAALPAYPLRVSISRDHFKQVLLNLSKNALEALEGGGEISIKAAEEGDRIRIRIADTGKGMSAETLRKLFVPFFTMKSTGTGLGLVVCKQILDSYGGSLIIDSRVGAGTTATIDLPAVQTS